MTAWLTRHDYAHRGLHSGAGTGNIPENTMAAFAAAVAHGKGIELDVQLSADDVAMVFHDDTLDRLTRQTGPVEARTAVALEAITINDTQETIPRLSTVLQLVAGRSPILVEIKANSDLPSLNRLCAAVWRDLADYQGPVAIMSFNPHAGAWFAANAPAMLRGLVATQENERSLWAKMQGAWARRQALRLSQAQFVALDIRDLPSRFSQSMRRHGVPVLTWTVRTLAQERVGVDAADALIFEQPTGAQPIGLVEGD